MAIFLTSITALLVHFFIFPIPEVSTIKALGATAAVNLVILSYHLNSNSATSSVSLIGRSFLYTVYLNLLFVSIFVPIALFRRLYFSPLTPFPGPKIAALSQLWNANQFRKGTASITNRALHAHYSSDFIRIGPNELSINTVEAIPVIYKGKYPRGTFYEAGALNGAFNLNMVRDYKVHTPWRRVWEKAFQASEIKEYDSRIEHHVDILIDVLRSTAGRELDCTKVMGDLAFDIMADLAFAHDSQLLLGGPSTIMPFIHKYLSALSVIATLRPLCQLAAYLPQFSDVKSFIAHGDALLASRQKLGASRKDIFSQLLAVDSVTGRGFSQAELNANASLVIAAGADTSSSVLAQTFMWLAKKPDVQKRLRAELDAVLVEKGEALTVERTKNLPYLNAIVNESLRLCNPIPSGVQATTPPEGVTISGVYVPGNVQVRIPHLIMRDERYFARGEEWLPERWLEVSVGGLEEGIRDRRAFVPFGYGVHSCVGKGLALNEIRLVLARVVGMFEVRFGDRWDEGVWEKSWRDHAVLQIGEVWVRFVERV